MSRFGTPLMAFVLGAGVFTPAPAPSPAPAGIDPLSLSPIAGWDFARSTLAVNTNGSGGVPATGGEIGYCADMSGNGRQLRALTGDGPLLRVDAGLSRFYAEYDDAVAMVLSSDAFTVATDFEIWFTIRARGWKSDAYMGSSRDAYAASVQQKVSSPNITAYDGAQSAETPMSLSAVHVVRRVIGGTDLLQVDNQTAITGNFGGDGISGGYNLGNGPNANLALSGDYDIFDCWIMPLLSAGNANGVRTFLGAGGGLSL